MGDAARDLRNACEWERATAAYLDGELEAASAAIFEAHAKECEGCSQALRDQRRLLCLLDNAFDETFEKKVALPTDFARVVKARAQTDMSGVRSNRERSISLKICLALGGAVFALLGVSTFDALSPLRDAVSAAAGVVGMATRTIMDAGAGAMVVAKAVGGGLVPDSSPIVFLEWTFIACGLALLLLMIGKYHRADLSD